MSLKFCVDLHDLSSCLHICQLLLVCESYLMFIILSIYTVTTDTVVAGNLVQVQTLQFFFLHIHYYYQFLTNDHLVSSITIIISFILSFLESIRYVRTILLNSRIREDTLSYLISKGSHLVSPIIILFALEFCIL